MSEQQKSVEYGPQRQRGGAEKGGVVDEIHLDETKVQTSLRYLKIFLLFIWWLGMFALIVLHGEEPDNPTFLAVSSNYPRDYVIREELQGVTKIRITLEGPFSVQKYEHGIGVLKFSNNKEIHLRIQSVTKDNGVEISRRNISHEWILKLVDEHDIENVDLITRTQVLRLEELTADEDTSHILIHIGTDMVSFVPLSVQYSLEPTPNHLGFAMGSVLIIVYFTLIIFDLIPHTFAAILVCSMSIGIVGWLHARPSFPQIMEWMNIEMFMVQFGTSIIVTLILKSGVYGWLAVRAFKECRGHIWPFLYKIISITFVMSLFFETTMVILIVGPLVLLMCQLMSLNAIPVVIILTCFIQIGEIALPYSSLLNHRICNQPFLVEKHLTEQAFIQQALPFCFVILITTFIYLRLLFRNSSKIGVQYTEADELKRIIDVLDDTAKTIAGYTKNEQAVKESVQKKVEGLKVRLKRLGKMPKPIENFEEKLERFHSKMGIRDKFILIVSIFPLSLIIFMTIVNFFKNDEPMAIGWTVILAALLFIIILGENDFDDLLYHVDWTTFIFLACRYVFTCCLNAMWIEDSIGHATRTLIYSSQTNRAWVAPVLVFWVASVSAVLLDNLAVANTMIHVVSSLSLDEELNLQLKPLIFATTFGLHIGAMGTLISSMTSLVFAGLAHRHSLKYGFLSHFYVCFPLLIINNIISTIYIVLVYYVYELY